jgi:hypothetical protein
MTMRRSMQSAATMAALVVLAGCASSSSTPGYGTAGGGRDRLASLPTSVAAVALAHGDALALTEAQRASLRAIQRGVDSANAPLRAQLDSLRPTQRPVNSRDMSEEQRQAMNARRTAVRAVVAQMRDNGTAVRERALAVLTPEQRTQAESLEADATRRADEALDRVGRSDDAEYRRGGRQRED